MNIEFSQKLRDYMERRLMHPETKWNLENRRWYLGYVRQYGAVCGVPRERKNDENDTRRYQAGADSINKR